MPNLTNLLELARCPHCKVDKPQLGSFQKVSNTSTHDGHNLRTRKTYNCTRCSGVILAVAKKDGDPIIEMYPEGVELDENIPNPARIYLMQAIDTVHSSAASVMVANSAIDAMLKEKYYKDGWLYDRINLARDDHLITKDMAKWAHEVRLDANEPRHADEEKPIPTTEDA